ncbi:MAG TPA: site-specific integrase [Ktedonobacteraceae bacterium]|nr:site-specific integrase [Ktedonobacteraceae bacterium]
MGKTHRKSIIKLAIERFDGLMAIGDSRFEAKQTAREEAKERGEKIWAWSDGKIRSYKTRTTYQDHTLRFIRWARETEGIKMLADLDSRAGELVSDWLCKETAAGQSAYTLKTERSALRMFFGDRGLAREIALPTRKITEIKRSRGPAARDKHFQPANWQPLIQFEQSVGLRRDELTRIKVEDVMTRRGELVAYVRNGKGGRQRYAPVIPGRETAVLAVVQNRKPEERIFDRVPSAGDIHSYRRDYAQALYFYHAPGWPALPPAKQRRLKPSDYNRDAAMKVSEALGHSRLDVVLRDYLR